ncbi:MAG TPA: alginate lyase family protein [Vicinamibacterales bacterium]
MPDVLAVTSPRRLFCVFEHMYSSVAVADAVAAGHFPIQGVTVTLGLEPDWLGAPLPRDREWRLEWSKFYYGLDLATAAERTGAARYLTTWQRLVSSWIAQVPIDHDPTDVIGRRIQNWLYAWSRFAERFDVEASMPGFEARLTDSLRAQVAFLRGHLTRERNHRTLELYALFVAALSLRSLDPDGSLLAFAIAALTENLLTDILPDGVHRERSTHYHHVVLRSFIGMRENARRFGLRLSPAFDERLTRACEFALHCHRPDGTIPALSDSDGGSYLDLLQLAGTLLERPDFTYVATRGRAGEPPFSRSASFPDGGYFVQRSGWGDRGRAMKDERYLILDCGSLGDGGHGHYDALSIEIAAEGGPLLIDPGRYTYCDDEPSHWRRWFKGTAAHNTVTVDGADQTPYRRGKPKGPVARAHLERRVTRPGLDVLWGEALSPAYDVVHRRRILFVGDEYWLIEDSLDADDPHRYQLRFHLTPDQRDVAIESLGDRSRALTPRLSLLVSGRATPGVEPGWVSFEYGTKHEAPVVTFTADGAARASFVTLVMPRTHANDPPPEFAVRFARGVATADVRCVAAGHVYDRVTWTLDGNAAPLGADAGTAVATWSRKVRP